MIVIDYPIRVSVTFMSGFSNEMKDGDGFRFRL